MCDASLRTEKKRIYTETSESPEDTEKNDALRVFVEPVEVGFRTGDDW